MDDSPQAQAKPPVPFPKTLGDWCRQLFGDGASAHPAVQFVKYAFVGGLATVVNLLATFVLARWVFPCITPDDPIVKIFSLDVPPFEGTDAFRAVLYDLSWVGAFLVSNVFCYFLNRAFVFVPGRMKAWAEFLSFMAAGAVAMLAGLLLSDPLIRFFGAPTSIGAAVNMVTSVLVNYACRKFIIFKG
jgi:putative flippase GtrA